MNTKAVVFDAYGTLFDVNSAAKKCKDKIGNEWESFANFWRTTQLEYTWLRSLMRRHRDFWNVTEDSLDKSMKVYGIDKNLKNKKFKIAILSNGNPTLLNDLVTSNNLNNLFDDLFSVEEVKIYKPDPRVYELPLKKYSIKANQVTFLSANTWDVSGGGNFGYNSIWVNRNNSEFDVLDYQPKIEINNLKQLLDII